MALFKIFKGSGVLSDLNDKKPITNEGYCYFTPDDGKFYIDIADGSDLSKRIVLNAGTADTAHRAYAADKLYQITESDGIEDYQPINAGDIKTPVYFVDGIPVPCESLTIDELEGYLPLTAGEEHKLTGPLGLTNTIGYGSELPAEGFEGQLFFLESDSTFIGLPAGGATGQILAKASINDGDAKWIDIDITATGGGSLPTGGSKGQVLTKNSSINGDASWQNIVALPTGGTTGQILIKTSATDGAATWQNFPSFLNVSVASANKLATTRTITLSGDVSGSGQFDGSGNLTIQTTNNANAGDNYLSSTPAFIEFKPSTSTTHGGYLDFHYAGNTSDFTSRIIESSSGTLEINQATIANGVITATQVYGAVYNDYAEYRDQKENIKPGYCVASADNGQVYKTTEKFQACDGIVSDTFGFAIGETDNCKTPLAVAGRVLAYYEGDRNDYHSGDTVCAGPEGKVCKMTREEIREWPDRIIGIVSEIPEYEIWGTDNVIVDGRIWIKIK